jgi:response regulator RpfG family c-di-GMP phosphodiesterase
VTHKEISLLYLAAWFHDIGYLHPLSIHDRRIHGEMSVRMIHRDPHLAELLSGDELQSLGEIIRAHDSHADLTSIRQVLPGIRIRLLAAIFQLMNATDIGTTCPLPVSIP